MTQRVWMSRLSTCAAPPPRRSPVEEIDAHLDLLAAEHVAGRGTARSAARRAARLRRVDR